MNYKEWEKEYNRNAEKLRQLQQKILKLEQDIKETEEHEITLRVSKLSPSVLSPYELSGKEGKHGETPGM